MKMKQQPLTTGITTRFILAASIACAFTFTACERKTTAEEPSASPIPVAQPAEPIAKTSTFETARLGAAIDKFKKTPTVENQSSVKLAFAELDGEIAELDDRAVKTNGNDSAEATAKSVNLKKYRDAEMIRFMNSHPIATSEVNSPADSRSGAQKMKDTAAKGEENVENGAKKVGKTIEKGVQNTGDALKDATK